MSVITITSAASTTDIVAQVAQELGVPVYCLGIGSTLGSKIPVIDGGTESFLRSRAGDEVVTSLDVAGLTRIAEATGGAFLDVGAAPQPLIELYDGYIKPMAQLSTDPQESLERKNHYQWPLLAAFALWMMEFLFTDRRKRRNRIRQ